ncbi:DUF4258 domain-containing protein [Chromohalobacter japonicus]|uniref:DUF4258 domain-containing protein n=1 Tax=Chromohalobacter japonicus TaxID=223900 RepID=UPI001FF1B230|nr:DUF4258 domain-containing protein [Chromohalobacter japonicus]MCK0752633.1 DUF4258 domain-containing protein [Chromohalobacter japonicus]
MDVYVTRHVRERMAQRGMTEVLLSELLETGQMRYKDDTRLWIAKAMEGRNDNLVCAAVVLEDRLVVKTVMHHFQWEE